MVKTFCQASGVTVASTANTTQYWPVTGFVKVNSSANKALSEIKFRSAGTLSNLLVKLSANSVGTTGCTFTLHKNGSNVTQTLAIGASATGDFEDTTHTDAVADADRFCLETDPIPTTGTFSMSLVSLLFDATTNTVTKYAKTDSISVSGASASTYLALNGSGSGSGSESRAICRFRAAGTLKRLAVYVSANRATATHVLLRKNGVDAINDVTITGGGAAGWYEDTTHTDTVTAGEDWNYKILTGTGVDTLTIQAMCCEFESTNGDCVCITANASGELVPDATTQFFHITGASKQFATETGATGCQTEARQAYTFSELTASINANAVTTASTLTLRKGAVDTTLIVSITGSTTGVFADSTHSETVAAGDLMSLEFTAPSEAGSVTVDVRVMTMIAHLTALTRISLSRIYKYNIIARTSLSRVYKYHVLGRTSLSRVYKYNILNRVNSVSVALDGTDDYLNCGIETGLWSGSMQKWSASIWFRTPRNNVAQEIVAQGNYFDIYTSAGGTIQADVFVTSDVTADAGAFSTNTWNNAIAVWDLTLGSANVKIYLNGVLGATTADQTGTYNQFTDLRLSSTAKPFLGNLKDFRFWNGTALTQTQINNIYANSSAAPTPSYWLPMNEGTGNPIDSISGTKTGTLTNGAIWNKTAPDILSGLSRVYKYNILSRISLSRIYKYNIIGRISLSRIYKYHIIGRISLSRIYKYHIVSRISLSRVYKYHVLARRSLSRIYKYHVLSRVSLSRIYKYHVAVRVSLSRIYKYHVLARRSLSRIYKYHVLGRISLSRIYKYHVIGRISLARIYKYHVLSRRSLVRIYKYHVAVRVSLSRIYKYHIAVRVSLSRIYKYHIAVRVSLSRVYKYHVLARISLVRIYKYHVLARRSLSRIYKYHVLGRVSLARIYKYNLIGRISLARIYLWNVAVAGLTRISLSRTYKYNVIQRLSLARVYKWHLVTRVSLSRIYKYHLQGRVSLQRIYKYHVLQRISQARIYKYNVLARRSLARIYKYHVLGRVSLARVYKYNIIARVSLARIYLWNVVVIGLTRISKPQIYKYNVATRVSLARIYKYNVAVRVSLTRIYKYHVARRVSLVRIYKYHLIGRISLARVYKYNLLGRISLARVYKWNVLQALLNRISKQQIYKYNMIGRISKSSRLKWNLATLAVTQWGKVREWIYAKYSQSNPSKQ